MAIGVIGWGSLIWCPNVLRLRTAWHVDGPRLPIEYARISKDGRLTLVIHESSADQDTLWAEWDGTDLETARNNLRVREGCALTSIHGVSRQRLSCGNPPDNVAGRVREWLTGKGLDAAIWTGLESNWQQKRQSPFSAEDAVEYLRSIYASRPPDDGLTLSRVREYIQNTPQQIQTEVRRRARAEFDWADADLSVQFFEPTA